MDQCKQVMNESYISETKLNLYQRKIELLEKENSNLLVENEILRDKSSFYLNKMKLFEEEN